MGTKLDIAYWNDVMEGLGQYYDIRHIKPLYGKEYIQFELIKEPLSNSKPTVVTIKSNKRIVFSVDCKQNANKLQKELQNIGINQTIYKRSPEFKGRVRIVCGHKQIDRFLGQLSTLSQYI